MWAADPGFLEPVPHVNRVDIGLIRGVDRVRDILIDNTRRFAAGLPANNALLWGARGMGKSSLVKAVHAAINAAALKGEPPLKLIEIHREDIDTLPKLLSLLKPAPFRFILFCDDLSFDHDDTSYKSLKAALEGGVEGRPANVIFYATSNRRHLLPRDMIDNERSTAINPSEAVEEKVSLSDRFGLWLGFHKCSQDEYLEMVGAYVAYHGLVDRPGCAARRGAGMGDDARQPFGPRRVPVHAGTRRPARAEAQGLIERSCQAAATCSRRSRHEVCLEDASASPASAPASQQHGKIRGALLREIARDLTVSRRGSVRG